jgi:hypothetical protein
MKNKRNFIRMRHHVLLLASALFVFTGCDEKPEEEVIPGSVLMEFNLTWNGDDCAIGDVQNDHLDHPLRIDNLQMYIAPVEMRNDRGEWVEIQDVALLDFGVHGQKITAAAEIGIYDGLRFGMGLPPEINTDIDPASYANDHPLSVPGSAGMFWTWASGYVFVKYEGKFAETTGSQLLEPLSYHCGTDESYRSVTFDFEEAIAIESQEVQAFSLSFNAAAALTGPDDSVDIVQDPVTHNAQGTILGARLMDLMDDAWTLSPL